jgi:GNAT superfamily N-acetyltransferase
MMEGFFMDEGYRLRRAQPDDGPAILAFQQAAIACIPGDTYPAPVMAAYLRQPVPGLDRLIAAGRYFVATFGDRPVAGAGWQPSPDFADTAAIRAVFVHPDHAAAGLGRALMAVAEDAAMTAGFAHILVPAALNAVGFYRRLGYHDGELGEVPLGPATAPVLRMWKHPAGDALPAALR